MNYGFVERSVLLWEGQYRFFLVLKVVGGKITPLFRHFGIRLGYGLALKIHPQVLRRLRRDVIGVKESKLK
jgi:hypothetical protein